MEVTIANCHDSSFSVAESKKDTVEFRENDKFSASLTKETMNISRPEPIWITGRPNPKEKRSAPFRDTIRRRPTLK